MAISLLLLQTEYLRNNFVQFVSHSVHLRNNIQAVWKITVFTVLCLELLNSLEKKFFTPKFQWFPFQKSFSYVKNTDTTFVRIYEWRVYVIYSYTETRFMFQKGILWNLYNSVYGKRIMCQSWSSVLFFQIKIYSTKIMQWFLVFFFFFNVQYFTHFRAGIQNQRHFVKSKNSNAVSILTCFNSFHVCMRWDEVTKQFWFPVHFVTL